MCIRDRPYPATARNSGFGLQRNACFQPIHDPKRLAMRSDRTERISLADQGQSLQRPPRRQRKRYDQVAVRHALPVCTAVNSCL